MFEGFANVWTPVALASDLRAGAPLGVQVAGTPLALFRDPKRSPPRCSIAARTAASRSRSAR